MTTRELTDMKRRHCGAIPRGNGLTFLQGLFPISRRLEGRSIRSNVLDNEVEPAVGRPAVLAMVYALILRLCQR